MVRALPLLALLVGLVGLIGVAAQQPTEWVATSAGAPITNPVDFIQPGTNSGDIILSTRGVQGPANALLEVMCDVAGVTEESGFSSAPVVGQTGPAGTATGALVGANVLQPSIAVRTCIIATSTVATEIGDLFFITGSTPAPILCPAGSLEVDGASYDRDDQNALFLVIGTTYGEGSVPGDTFAVPNLVERVPIGAGSEIGPVGTVVGADFVPLDVPSHSHTTVGPTGAHAPTGGSVSLDVRQPALALNFRVVTVSTGDQAEIGTIKITARNHDAPVNAPQDPYSVPADGRVVAELEADLAATWGANGATPNFDGEIPMNVDPIGFRMPIGTTVGSAVGLSSVSITNAHVPAHSHWSRGLLVNTAVIGSTAASYSAVQESLVVKFMINFDSSVVAASGFTRTADTPFVGEVRLFAGNSVPLGWLQLDLTEISGAPYENLLDVLLDDPAGTTGVPESLGCTLSSVGTRYEGHGPHNVLANQVNAQYQLSLSQLASHVHVGTAGNALVSSGLVKPDATTPFEYDFTLSMPATALFVDECDLRFTQDRDVFLMPGDQLLYYPVDGNGDPDYNGTPTTDPTSNQLAPQIEVDSFSFAIGADCTLPASAPTFSTGGTCTPGGSLNPGQTCTYTFDTATHRLASGTATPATPGSATVTCGNNAPTDQPVNPTFAQISDCVTSELNFAQYANAILGTDCGSQTSFAQNDDCVLECAVGYTRTVAGVQTCSTNAGAWTTSDPQCQLDCTIPVIADTTVVCTQQVSQTTFSFGGVCTYTAAGPFYRTSPEPTKDVTCKANGVASSPDAGFVLPVFASSSCTASPAGSEGTFIVNTGATPGCAASGPWLTGSVCATTCQAGFTTASGGSRTCTNSVWSGVVEDCLADCPSFAGNLIPTGGEVIVNSCGYPAAIASGVTCTTQASPDFRFVSSANGGSTAAQTFTCTDGSVSAYPTYVSTKCPVYQIPAGATNVNLGTCSSTAETSEGSNICTLDCIAPSTRLSGGLLSCSQGNWTGSLPVCAAPCGLQTGTGYTVDCDGANDFTPAHDDECTYTADATHYRVSGGTPDTISPLTTATAACSSGVIDTPVFALRSCGAAYTPSSPATKVSGTCAAGAAEGSSCTLTCESGFTQISTGTQTCTLGSWGGTLPVCKRNCNSGAAGGLGLPTIPGATLSCQGASSPSSVGASVATYTSGDSGTCTYTADADFHQVANTGSTSVVCTDGSFATNRPQFTSSLCAPFSLQGSATWGDCDRNMDDAAPSIIKGTCQLGCTNNPIGNTPRTPVSGTGIWTCFEAVWTVSSYPTCGAPCDTTTGANAANVVPPAGSVVVSGTCGQTIPDGTACEFDPAFGKYLASGTDVAICNDGTIVAAPTGVFLDSFCTAADLQNQIDAAMLIDSGITLGNCAVGGTQASGNTCQLQCDALTHVSDGPGGALICTNSVWSATGGTPFLPACKSSRCNPPVLNANVVGGSCRVGRTLSSQTCALSCAAGYTGAGSTYTCSDTNWQGFQPTCSINADPNRALEVSAPQFVQAGESEPIIFTVPLGGVVAADFTIRATCDAGSIQCAATGCLAGTCDLVVKAGATSATFMFTAPATFSATPATCSFAYTAAAPYLVPADIKIGYGSPAGLTVAIASGTMVGAPLAGTITPEWAPSQELTVLAFCRAGSIAPVYIAAGSRAAVAITYTPSGINREDVCTWEIRSTDDDVTSGRFAAPADTYITIGEPARTFTFIGPSNDATIMAQAGDAMALYVKPSLATNNGPLTLTLTCSGGHVGSVTWPAGSTKLQNIPYVASPQCGVESCRWSVSTTATIQAAIDETASYKVPNEAKWSTIQVAGQTMAYRQWRNQVRINNGRKP